MIVVGDIPILTSITQIMTTLQQELQMEGSHYLRELVLPKGEGQDIQFPCPYHKNGMENKPSCGITTVIKKRGGKEIPIGQFHCFSCSAHGDITELISYCFGRQDAGIFGKNWILDHFGNYEIEKRSGFFKKLGLTKEKNVVKYVSESELEKYRFTHPYMYERGLTDEIIDIFDIGYDKSFSMGRGKFSCITFPVKDENGNVLFIARRSIKGKIYHYPEKVDKPLYGLYESKLLFPKSNTLWICESIFNALTMIKWKKPCVALLGTGSTSQIEQLKQLDYRRYVICLDGDLAGQKGTQKLIKALKKNKLLESIEMVSGKDVNDFRDCVDYDEFLSELKKGEM